jgi:hypothetical protein
MLPIVRSSGVPVLILLVSHEDIFPEVIPMIVEVGNPPIEKSGKRLGGSRDGPPVLADGLLIGNPRLTLAVKLARPIDLVREFSLDWRVGRARGIGGRFARRRGGIGGCFAERRGG